MSDVDSTQSGSRSARRSQLVHLNGINAATGVYLHPPRELATLAGAMVDRPAGRPSIRVARRTLAAIPAPRARMSLVGADSSDVDPRTGWAILFASDESDDVRRALTPLIEHRKRQVGASYRELEPYVKGCGWLDWLGAHDAIPGILDTTKIPYYVAVVGGPERIPYGFEYLMGVEYAVGRISFESADEYAAYAESVVKYETMPKLAQGKWAGFFGTSHKNDGATQGSAEHLIGPLSRESWGVRERTYLADEALKSKLMGLLHAGEEPLAPAFLFTATHGAAFPIGHALARERNGALVCQDWPGVPPGAGPNTILSQLKGEHYLSARDITEDTRIHGMIAFHFACFGAGTPLYDNFSPSPGQPPIRLAEQPFVARLPQRMMSHPKGGALAVIGHVDRVWTYYFQTASAGDQIGPFRETIRRIFRGQSVGRATKEFKERYAALCVYLVCMQQKQEAGQHVEPEEHAQLLTECNDAQNYVVLGDPAVKLRVDEPQ